ncbi:condensation domain-containing protein [Micromonospora zamorensis]|uniref:condensation domain-containing protein n=1 Tax=Micromonospora zamorensis TaxID=709883 RepID=UPI0033FF8261
MTDARIPLSPAQERQWALAQIRPGDPFYNHPFTVTLGGPLDVPALRRAFADVVARHAPLRSRVEGGALLPGPEPAGSWEPVEMDEATAGATADAFGRQPFDLAAGPLLRTRLLRLDPQRHWLLVCVHHIVFDAASLEVFQDELAARYAARLNGDAPAAEPVDYAAYWAARLAAAEHAHPADLRYWADRLAGAPEAIDLLAMRVRPVQPDHRGATRSRLLGAGLVDPLRALARRRRATLYMVLKAASDVLLSGYAGGVDVTTGIALSGRDVPGSTGLIGFLARPVVLRSDLGDDPPFLEAVSRVRNDVLGAHEHPELPFEETLAATGAARDPSYHPLYQVMFGLHDSAAVRSAGGVRFGLVEAPLRSMKVELDIALIAAGDGLRAEFSYRADLFDAATVDGMLDRYAELLHRVAADPSVRVSALWADDAPPADSRTVDRAVDVPAHGVAGLFVAQAARTPAAVAVRAGSVQWTYAELAARAGAVARLVTGRGAGAEDRVGICLPASPELVAAFLGVLLAGAAPAALDPAEPAFRLRLRAEDLEPELVLVNDTTAAEFGGADVAVVRVEPGDTGPAGEPPSVRPEQAACVVYSASVTDDLHPVVVTHRNLAGALVWARRTWPQGELAEVPLAGRLGGHRTAFAVLAALSHGGTVRVGPDATAGDGPTPRWGTWGCAETGGPVLAGPAGSLGAPRPDALVHVLDSRLRPVPAGVAGRLYIGGDAVAREYLDLPAETAARFVPDPYAGVSGARMVDTGDLVRRDADGALHFLARADQFPRRRGVRTAPGTVAGALRELAEVAGAEAVATPDGAIAAAVRPAPGTQPTAATVRCRLAERVPGYLLPDRLAVLETLPDPADPRGFAAAVTAAAAVQEQAGPATETERMVAGAWTAVLGRPGGTDQNFFDVGGNSMLLIRLRALLAEASGRDVAIVELFRHPTVRAMAAHLAAGAQPSDAGQSNTRPGAAVARARARQEAVRQAGLARAGHRRNH